MIEGTGIFCRMRFWPSKRTAPVEHKTLASPTPEELSLFSGLPIGAGGLSLQGALSVPAVACAVRVISEAAASLEIKVMKTEDGKSVAVDHPAGRLLQGDVNEWTSGFELIRDLVAGALCHDKGALAWVNRPGGEVREIVGYEPAHWTVAYSTDGRAEPSYTINNVAMPSADIIHLRGPFSRCPITMAADAIAAAKSMEGHAAGLFKNGARPSGVIEVPGKIGDDGLAKMKAGWRAAHEGSANSGKTAILFDGAHFSPLTMASTDSQFLENRKFQLLEIARAFRVPPSMLYELDRATWSNSEQMGREFLTYTLEPWLQALEGVLSRALFTPMERPTHRVIFDRDDLTRADIGQRATAYSSLIASRILNPNEARRWEGLEPYADGEAFANPNIETKPKAI